MKALFFAMSQLKARKLNKLSGTGVAYLTSGGLKRKKMICEHATYLLNLAWIGKSIQITIKTLHQLALLQVVQIFVRTFVRIGWEDLENSHGWVKKWNSNKSCPHQFLNSTLWMSASLQIPETNWRQRSKLEHRMPIIFKNKHTEKICIGYLI